MDLKIEDLVNELSAAVLTSLNTEEILKKLYQIFKQHFPIYFFNILMVDFTKGILTLKGERI